MKQESERLLNVLLGAITAPSNLSQDPTLMKWAAGTIEKIIALESFTEDATDQVRDLRKKYNGTKT